MKRIIYCTLLISIFSIGITSCKKKTDDPVVVIPVPIDTLNHDMNETAVINAGWTKTFNEDFSTDFSNWNIWQGGAYNNEYECYTSAPKNLSLTNGILSITAIKETVTGNTTNTETTQKSFDFTSARIESKSTISASSATPKIRYSARIKLPSGYGMWPAFWSYGANWPTNGEIDVMEAKGNLPLQFATNYFYGATAGTSQVGNSGMTYVNNIDLTEYWHVYEVIWEQNSLTFMLDGKVIRTLATTSQYGSYVSAMFGKTQNIALNLAVGGDYFKSPNLPDPSTIVTGTMQVDWVRVFTGK
jgi:beta-glucanase (GH16 family)